MGNNNLADQYYLKATMSFWFAPDEALEQLGYAISYNEEHAPSYYLMGMLYVYDIGNYTEAKHAFECALLYDAYYINAYEAYLKLCVLMHDHKTAERLIQRAAKISYFPRDVIYETKMSLYEGSQQIERAWHMGQLAIRTCGNNRRTHCLKQHIERLEGKMTKAQRKALNKVRKPKKKKKKRKCAK